MTPGAFGRVVLLAALAGAAGPVAAQYESAPLDQPQNQPRVSVAREGAVLRGLDRVSGALTEMRLAPGETQVYGGLDVTLGECRYPAEDPASDAFAQLTIADTAGGEVIFEGWMIASSPALMALDHPRYDVWVISCRTSEGEDGAD
ncbi:DUF2155 domain-containing protein [Maritimibacter sp. 55A14]|uniref:DUF2155 domain-containing protein n=1 Tax=Maritimibacter sp. 55A14 TaxID=2174844 RepID=UPI000D61BFBD|nr:DUF2155 domain-containing protein [Maritimibacter sp. 55A14]PWE30463.1 DUF2155 domain-containing protein [Maritimibacter sp. 55A14]